MLKRRDMSPQQQSKRRRYGNICPPPVPLLNSRKDPLIFQELQVDHYIGRAYPGMPGPRSGSVPIIRMFGVTKSGNSVCCHVHGFSPYFFVNLPDSFSTTDLAPFKNKLNYQILAHAGMVEEGEIPDAVLTVELVRKKSEEPTENNTKFAKITLSLPRYVLVAKRLLTSITIHQPLRNHSFLCYGAHIAIENRFMVHTSILGCCWIELPADKWFLRSKELSSPGVTSRCQIEVDVSWKNFIAHAPENEWATVAKFRKHSFDIECVGRKGIFPEPRMDPVVQIANVVKHHGEENDVITRTIFTLNSCAPIDHAEIFSFDTEEAMLEAWAEFVQQVDPDIFTGYNIHNFDFPYLINRARHLKLENFNFLGRMLNVRSQIKRMQNKVGHNYYKSINFEGRVVYDMLLVARRDLKLECYKLNNVCQELLGEQKDDVPYRFIFYLQNGNAKMRRTLALYCLKDAELPLKLMNAAQSFTKDVAKARITGMTVMREVNVLTQLLRAEFKDYFI